jgi:hypothetical protein
VNPFMFSMLTDIALFNKALHISLETFPDK